MPRPSGVSEMRGPVVVAAEAGRRPAVVASRQDDVDLVAAVRPVLGVEHGAGGRVHGEAELIAMPHREDLGPRPGSADERIVGRDLAVVAQPQHLAVDAVQLLRLVVERRAGRHVERPSRPKARREPLAPSVPIADEQLFDARSAPCRRIVRAPA